MGPLGWINKDNELCSYEGPKVLTALKTSHPLTPLHVDGGLLYIKERDPAGDKDRIMIVDVKAEAVLFSTSVPRFQHLGPLGYTLSVIQNRYLSARDIFTTARKEGRILTQSKRYIQEIVVQQSGYLAIDGLGVHYFDWWFDERKARPPGGQGGGYIEMLIPPMKEPLGSDFYWYDIP